MTTLNTTTHHPSIGEAMIHRESALITWEKLIAVAILSGLIAFGLTLYIGLTVDNIVTALLIVVGILVLVALLVYYTFKAYGKYSATESRFEDILEDHMHLNYNIEQAMLYDNVSIRHNQMQGSDKHELGRVEFETQVELGVQQYTMTYDYEHDVLLQVMADSTPLEIRKDSAVDKAMNT